jgi:hypothetical protein
MRNPNEEFPQAIANLVRDVGKDRDSPGPSPDQLRDDEELYQLENGAGEPAVENYFKDNLFPKSKPSGELSLWPCTLLDLLRDDEDLRILPLLVTEPSEGGGRDFASEVLFLLSSRRLSNESRISFSRMSFPQSMMLRTCLRKSK